MILTRKFEWGDHDDYGHGWITQGMPGFDPVQGLGAAHDTLEHFDSDTSLEAEFRAFGCILWGRVMGGYWYTCSPSRRTPAEHIAADVTEFLMRSDLELLEPDRRHLLKIRPLDDEGAEEELEKIIVLARKHLPGEFESYHGKEVPGPVEIEEALHKVKSWMRWGYRRADRRFGPHMDSCEFAYLFDQVEREFDRLSEGGEPGEVIRVRVDTKTQEFTIKRRFQDY